MVPAGTYDQGESAYLILAAGCDFGVVLRAGVQVVVVCCQASSSQLCCLLWCEHTQSGADFHVQPSNLAHHGQNTLPLSFANLQYAAGG